MWAEYIYKYYNVLDSQRASKAFTAGYIPDRLEEYLSKVTEGTCEICGYNYKKIWGEDCEQNNHFVRFIPRRTDQNARTATTSGNTSTASALAAANCHTRRLVRNWAKRTFLTMNYGSYSKWGKSDYIF